LQHLYTSFWKEDHCFPTSSPVSFLNQIVQNGMG
jgi:hypothetical protein